MPLYLGAARVAKLHKGSTRIKRAYQGAVKVLETEFAEDFGGFATGAGLPAGFTSVWESSLDRTFSVQNATVGGSVSGKELKFTTSGATINTGIAFNVPGKHVNGEVLARGYAVSHNTGVDTLGVGLRMLDTGTTGYRFSLLATAGGPRDRARLTRIVNAGTVELGNEEFLWDWNTRYYFRLRALGTELKAKVWAVNGPEPGPWLIEATDAGISAAGFAGLTQRNTSCQPAFDYIAVALGGGTAPLPV